MTLKPNIDEFMIQQWGSKNLDLDQVKQKLMELELDTETCEAYFFEFRKLYNRKRQSKGFTMVTIGALLGFLSCVITMVNPFPNHVGIFLYGFTSVAVTIAFIGFYFIFE